ncbi:MAG: hypothetical protein ACE14S_02265 [Candidatus Bathyarchaeia archaeon]
MSREKTKAWTQIGKLTEDWVKASYPNAKTQDAWKYQDRMNNFLEFIGLTDAELIESYKRSKDRVEWSKQIGQKVIAYYNHRVQEGKATNTARAEVSTVRAFCRDNATTLILSRRKIAKAKSAKGEHEFNQTEFQQIFHIADIFEKAVVATAISLGYHVEDFSELKRADIEPLVNKAIEQKIDFIGFSFERGKTGVTARSHLTPEARDSLKAWFSYIDQKRAEKGLPVSEWVWANGNGGHVIDKTFNTMLKDLCKKANVTLTGKVRFALFRKFLMGALSDAKLNSFLIKRAVGKEISSSDDTYLQHIDRQLDETFHEVYPYIRLNGTLQSRTRIEDLEAKIQQLEIQMEGMAIENQTLKRIIEYSIPKTKVQDAIKRIATENGLNVSEFTGRDFFKTPIAIELLIAEIAKKKQAEKQQPEQPKEPQA